MPAFCKDDVTYTCAQENSYVASGELHNILCNFDNYIQYIVLIQTGRKRLERSLEMHVDVYKKAAENNFSTALTQR